VAPRDAHLTRRLQPFTTTIFATMSELALATSSVNLGQGFPDADGPAELREVAVAAIREGRNQYPPSNGVPELRQAVAAHQRAWYGIDLDPEREVLVTVGATEAIAATMLALCEPGDEVVMFEPTYDSYAATASMAGATPRLVRLHPPDWRFDPDELAAVVGPRTKMVLLNSPHNPTGKVFSPEELAQVAALCAAHDLLAVTDEVYEHLVFEGSHVPLATLPGMGERTLTISSGGKTFSFTGWKVGWAPFQLALAVGLGFAPEAMGRLATELQARRDQLCTGLDALGYEVFRPAATYFATTDIAAVAPGRSAQEFCLELPARCGVVAIPSSVFYDATDPGAGRTLVRWAFCKRADVLDDALTRLASWAS
jgi:N-succinyldiaminopimelate aminotransferase